MKSGSKIILVVCCLAVASGVAVADPETPLAAFGALVVGEWEAEDSRHVLEWGVGQRTIRSRSYQRADDGWTLVAEGMWFWDGGQETIRGVVVAGGGMPVELFEYRSAVRGRQIVHDLAAQGAAGGEYVERWSFEQGVYRWSLEAEHDGNPTTIMGGVYRRK